MSSKQDYLTKIKNTYLIIIKIQNNNKEVKIYKIDFRLFRIGDN